MKMRQSPWIHPPIATDGPLVEDLATDVCIVGAGIAGLSVGYELSGRGHRVVVVEAGSIGSGETLRTTAHLASALDDRWFEIERVHGEPAARLAARCHAAAIDAVEAAVIAERITCQFMRLDGILVVPDELADQAGDLVEREYDAATRAGLEVEVLSQSPVRGAARRPCLRFGNQGQIEPSAYLSKLAAAIRRRGGRIHTDTRMERMEGGAGAYVEAGGRRIQCEAIVVATNTPVNDRVAMHTKQAAYRTYAIGLEAAGHSIPRILLWDGYWTDRTPYHYVRLADLPDETGLMRTILVVGGEDHKTGQQEEGADPHGRLEAWARRTFRDLGEVTHRWSGQVMEPHDHLSYIGRNPLDADNVYIVTGDSGNGMTHGALAGTLISDLIEGRSNDAAEIFRPSRVSVRTAGQFAKENVNFVAQYRDWALPAEVGSVEEIPRGSGAVLRTGMQRIAAHRDDDGEVTLRSAVCPHLGCVVRWNAIERSWDCPCHGSRFDAAGCVLNGPANTPLAEVELPPADVATRQADAPA